MGGMTSQGIQITDKNSALQLIRAWAGKSQFYIRSAAESAELWGNHQRYEHTSEGRNLREAAQVLRSHLATA